MNPRRRLVCAAVLLVSIVAIVCLADNSTTKATAGGSPVVLPSTPAATVSPVQIQVAKIVSWQPEHEISRPAGRNVHAPITTLSTPKQSGMHLEITLSNLSPTVYPRLVVKWAVLLRGTELKEGQIGAPLGLGQTLARKTENLRVTKEADLSGYRVQLLSDGQVIGSAEDPPGMGDRIEKLRAARARPKPK